MTDTFIIAFALYIIMASSTYPSDITEFKKINFGKADAGTEKQTPALLLDGFFDEGYADKIMAGEAQFVFGLKGSGKSAIGSRIELLSKKDKEIVVHQCELDNFDYSGFGGVVPGRKPTDEKNQQTWEFLIAITLFNMYEKTAIETIDSAIKYKNVIDGLKTIGLLPDRGFNSIIDKLKGKKLKMSASSVSVEIEPTQITEHKIKRLVINTVSAMYSVSPEKKHFIIIDGLDSVLTKRLVQYSVLSSLIHTVNFINKKFIEKSINSQIVVLCRTDVLDRLSDPDRTKHFSDSGIFLDWYQSETDKIEDNNLCKLINLRARVSLKRPVNVFDEFFPPSINTGGSEKHTVKYLLERTRHTPRDIIQLMNYIQKESWEKATEGSIKKGLKKYSEVYFLSEVCDSFVGFLSKEEVDGTIAIIRSIGYTTTTIDEMKKESLRKGLNLDLNNILSVFYDEGVIGNIEVVSRQSRNGLYKESMYFHYKFRNRTIPFNEKQQIHIHAGLHRALNLKQRLQTESAGRNAIQADDNEEEI